MAYLKILQFLPEILKVIKSIIFQIKEGRENQEIREGLKEIDVAFTENDPRKRARKLNEIFNKKNS